MKFIKALFMLIYRNTVSDPSVFEHIFSIVSTYCLLRNNFYHFFFYLGFLWQTFTTLKTAGEGRTISLNPLYHFQRLYRDLNTKLCALYCTQQSWISLLHRMTLSILPSDLFLKQNIDHRKEVLYLRWNEHHLSTYFGTLMSQL